MEDMVCPNCGYLADSESVFCAACGCRLRESTEDDMTAVGTGFTETCEPSGSAAESASKASPKKRKWVETLVSIVLIAVFIVIPKYAAEWRRDDVKGKWCTVQEGQSIIVVFGENGVGSMNLGPAAELGFTYKVSGKKITISINAQGLQENVTIPYEIKENEMYWTDPETGERYILSKMP